MKRFQFRLALWRIRRKAPEHAATIDSLLASQEAFDECCAAAQIQFEQTAAGIGSPLTDFFQFLLDHADEIIAIILKLLPLFTTPA